MGRRQIGLVGQGFQSQRFLQVHGHKEDGFLDLKCCFFGGIVQIGSLKQQRSQDIGHHLCVPREASHLIFHYQASDKDGYRSHSMDFASDVIRQNVLYHMEKGGWVKMAKCVAETSHAPKVCQSIFESFAANVLAKGGFFQRQQYKLLNDGLAEFDHLCDVETCK